jgi:acetyl esterase/lipase
MRHFVGHYVTAYGEDARKRRDSRVELWSKQDKFALGFLYPQTDGRESLVCAITPAAKKALATDNLDTLRANLSSLLGEKAANIAKFISEGPEIKLAMEQPPQQLLAAQQTDDVKIEHGIGFRLRLPYPNPGQLNVQLNGATLARSATDGFESWLADGFTQVQVNVPPQRAAKAKLFIVTCSYQPDKVRLTGWMPPAEVQKETATAKAIAAPATLVDLPYGPHFRQTMDVWLAHADKPSPLVFYIHGGGWANQDKTDIHQHLEVLDFVKNGISVVSINYRHLQDANAAKFTPPIEWPLEDAARALQFVRSKAGEWHIDKSRVAATGVSAGGASSLWLGMHDDMAAPQSSDPIARESTRLFCIAVKAPVVSLDPQQVRGWIPNAIFGAHAFGYADLSRAASFEPFLAAREKYLPDIRRYSPYELASKDDPPVFVEFPNQDKPPVPGEPQTDPNHSAISGLMLERRLQELGVKVELRYKNDGRTGHKDVQEYLTEALTKS